MIELRRGRGKIVAGLWRRRSDGHQAHARICRVLRSLALLLLTVVPGAAIAAEIPRGGIAFFYGRAMAPKQLDFYSRFSVVVTHDPLPEAQRQLLQRRGVRLALYEWTVAFYPSLVRSESWQERLLGGDRAALLNSQPLRGGLGSTSADAFYYDPAHPDYANARAESLIMRLAENGYDGVFFDTTTWASVHADARAEFQQRHPGMSYDGATSRFLAALRRRWPGIRIVTNQGYRAAEHYLPYADWEVTESIITWPREGRFVFRPWDDAGDPWNSTAFLMRELIAPARLRYPSVRFAHLNYLDAPDPTSVARIVEIARTFGDDAFVTVPSLEPRGEEIYDAYFAPRVQAGR